MFLAAHNRRNDHSSCHDLVSSISATSLPSPNYSNSKPMSTAKALSEATFLGHLVELILFCPCLHLPAYPATLGSIGTEGKRPPFKWNWKRDMIRLRQKNVNHRSKFQNVCEANEQQRTTNESIAYKTLYDSIRRELDCNPGNSKPKLFPILSLSATPPPL